MPTNYRPDLCTVAVGGGLKDCRRVGFGELLEKYLWDLIARPLGHALCSPKESASGQFSHCSGTVSRKGDLLRISGVIPQSADTGAGTLTVYLEAVPTERLNTELLKSDLLSLVSFLGPQGFQVASQHLWRPQTADLDASAGTAGHELGQVSWISEGFSRLRTVPKNFGVRADEGFESQVWFPALLLRMSDPYIINSHKVPDWHFKYPPTLYASVATGHGEQINKIQSMGATTIQYFCGFLGAIWFLVAVFRFCGWRFLYGSSGHWQFSHTVRSVCFIAAITDACELATVCLVFGTTFWLSSSGVFADAGAADFRRPGMGALLLPLPFAVVLTPFLMMRQLLFNSNNDSLVPSRVYVCCLRVQKRIWFRCLVVALSVHGMVALLVLLFAALKMVRQTGSEVHSGRAQAVASCASQVAQQCTVLMDQQIRDMRYSHRAFCEHDCSKQPIPASDVAASFEHFVYSLGLAISAWSLLARSLQIWCTLGLVDSWQHQKRKKNMKKMTADEEADASKAAAAAIEAAAANGFVLSLKDLPSRSADGQEPPSADAMTAGAPPMTRKPASCKRPNVAQVSTTCDANADPMERILAAVAAVENPDSIINEPSTGKAVHSALAAPTAKQVRDNKLQNEASLDIPHVSHDVIGKERSLLDFAQGIARQCSRDSIASRDSHAVPPPRILPESSSSGPPERSNNSAARAASSSSGKKRFVAEW